MKSTTLLKGKIFNDPIYGFITIPEGIIFELIEHPYFQRLRRIKQLGLTHLVYSGALHTRFHHAIGAMHLMQDAVETIRSKGTEITDEEREAVFIAILLHDIGHGPFSHALEHSIVGDIHHEDLSTMFMRELNKEFDGKLGLAIEIFENRYAKKFLHQLVSSQLDMDRLDYLRRDSFFSGVSEGVISSDRIVKMLNVQNDQLAIELKGIYSVEKFIVARRLMYWQVYLHKTVIAAEFLLVKILKRAKELASDGIELFGTAAFKKFLYGNFSKSDFNADSSLLKNFAKLDDYDVMASVKEWMDHSDKILSILCKKLIKRELFKVELSQQKFSSDYVSRIKLEIADRFDLSKEETDYLVFTDVITNSAYNPEEDRINILNKNGEIFDLVEAADLLNISALSKKVEKHFMCYPKARN